MIRKESEQSPRAMAPFPRKQNLGLAQTEVYQMMKEVFHRWDRQLDVILDEKRTMVRLVARLEQALDA